VKRTSIGTRVRAEECSVKQRHGTPPLTENVKDGARHREGHDFQSCPSPLTTDASVIRRSEGPALAKNARTGHSRLWGRFRRKPGSPVPPINRENRRSSPSTTFAKLKRACTGLRYVPG